MCFQDIKFTVPIDFPKEFLSRRQEQFEFFQNDPIVKQQACRVNAHLPEHIHNIAQFCVNVCAFYLFTISFSFWQPFFSSVRAHSSKLCACAKACAQRIVHTNTDANICDHMRMPGSFRSNFRVWILVLTSYPVLRLVFIVFLNFYHFFTLYFSWNSFALFLFSVPLL